MDTSHKFALSVVFSMGMSLGAIPAEGQSGGPLSTDVDQDFVAESTKAGDLSLDASPGAVETPDVAPIEPSGIALDEAALQGADDQERGTTQLEPMSSDPVVPDVETLGWDPVLNENFDGPAVDEDVWRIKEGPGLRGGLYTQDAVRIEQHPDEPGNSMLTLTAYTEGGEHYGGTLYTGSIGEGNDTMWSGFQSAYGYVEARIQLNDGLESQGAFWTMPATSHPRPYGDPAEGGPEIDIMESAARPDGDQGICDVRPELGVPCNEQHRANLHWGGFQEGRGNDGTWYANPTSESLQGNFHEYGLLWTPEGYRFYLDGIEVYRSEHAISYGLEHFILGQYVRRGRLPAGHDYGDLEQSDTKLMVDYVKVWQRPVSEIPDQQVGQEESLSVPFTVTDYAYTGAGHDDPGSVRVSATSSDQTVVDDDKILVTGNGSASPQGSFDNGSFENGTTGWSLSGTDTAIWSGRARTGTQSLRLEKSGGRAEQTITGLQPNTRYMVGGWYNLELEWNDSNSNGKVDQGETFLPDGSAAWTEWGIEDVNADLPGDQTERVRRHRNGWREHDQWWSIHEDDWTHDTILFSTGPDTTEVTLYVDNTEFAGTSQDSNLSFDDFYIRPIVSANRTVTMRPEAGASGATTIELAAIDADDQVIGTDEFTVTVGGSSFTNGGFESHPIGAGWDSSLGGTQVVVDDPFTLDRALELGRDGIGTLMQEVVGLEPDTDYVLEAAGRLDADHGDAGVVVDNHGGPQQGVLFLTDDWEKKMTTFHTGPSSTSATVLVLDWDVETDPNEWSLIDDIKIYPSQTATPGGGPAIPALGDIDELAIPSTSPAAISFDAPGAVISGVESDNPHVLPDINLDVAGSSDEYVLGLTPVPERTGKATVRVFTNTAQTAWQDINVVVSERHLRNPGFESTWNDGWSLSGGSSVTDGGQRTGERALELPDGGTAVQELTPTNVGANARLGLPCNTPFAVGGWASGDVQLTVNSPGGTSGTVDWSGSGWSEEQTTFVSPGCYYRGPQTFGITLENTSAAGETAQVDDLYLLYAPKVGTIRDVSVHQGHTSFHWQNQRDFHVGHITNHALWDPSLVTITSSDETVVPLSNINLTKATTEWSDVAAMHTWRIHAAAGTKTGRSDVTIAVTDPATDVTTEETFTVTINADANLNNGDFQRNLAGWEDGLFGFSFYDLQVRRRTPLGNPPPTNYDQVLRISDGIARYRITDLEPETDYVVRASAFGEGSHLQVRGLCVDDLPEIDCLGDDGHSGHAPIIAQEEINSPSAWSPVELNFTTGVGETEAWIFLTDEDLCWPFDPGCTDHNPSGYEPGWPNNEPCVVYDPTVSGSETCFDDIGIFKASDLN